MTARKDAGQTSFVPAKVLRRLLQEQPTPFYLYDETMLREACEKLRLAFSWNAGFTPVFPVRMNQNPAVLRILASAGAQLLCVIGILIIVVLMVLQVKGAIFIG